MRQVKRLLPYVRRYVQMAVYDVLDAEGAEYWKNENTGRMKAARWSPGFRFTGTSAPSAFRRRYATREPD